MASKKETQLQKVLSELIDEIDMNEWSGVGASWSGLMSEARQLTNKPAKFEYVVLHVELDGVYALSEEEIDDIDNWSVEVKFKGKPVETNQITEIVI